VRGPATGIARAPGAGGSTVGLGALASFVLVSALLAPREVSAQSAVSKSATASSPGDASKVPLGRYVAKENILMYMEFAGLDAHAESWRNTAAYKMLNDTPLGEMLEAVAGQLVDKALTFLPNKRLTGPELVKLAKGAARSGWVFAVHFGPKVSDAGATLVLRGAASKELKPLSSRLMGWMMGPEKPKIERKDGGRTLVVVTSKVSQAGAGAAAVPGAWFWWPEKNDLVIGSPFANHADRIVAALDGKVPSAVEHPVVQELQKPEGSFQPVCVAFVDVANSSNMPSALTTLLHQVHEGQGVDRIDLQWGFDAEALMSVTRFVAPKPWKSFLALLDQPTFEKTALMPMPDSVESFVELSISPSKLLETLEQMGPAEGGIKAQIEELNESIKTAGSIDLKKDILGHLGPRMAAYLAPGRSATTNDDSLESALKNGLSTTAAFTAMQSFFPKLTLVAEVDNPEAFGKGLDTAMIAINSELKAQAIEKAAEHAAADKASPADGGGAGAMRGARPGGGRAGRGGAPEGGGERTKRGRAKTPSYPHFQATISPVKDQNSGSLVKTFVLTTPTDSLLRFGPSSFRPTILLEDKYVAFAVSSDAARAALAAAKRKDWKPSSDIERACEKVPSNLVLLSVNDVRESLSSLLASLPGTLQTMINTSIALAKARASGAKPDAPPGQAEPPTGVASREAMMRRGGRGGGPRAAMPGGRPGFGANNESGSTPSGGTAGSAEESMIVLKVDADKLPKAADLKARIFPSTLAISPAKSEIRFVSRSAFPDLSLLVGAIPAAGMLPGAASQPGPPGTGAPGSADSSANAPGAGAPKDRQPATRSGGPPGRRPG
jgi:hypothetical protein